MSLVDFIRGAMFIIFSVIFKLEQNLQKLSPFGFLKINLSYKLQVGVQSIMRSFSASLLCSLLISSMCHIKVTDFGLSKAGPLNKTTVPNKGCTEKILREFTDAEVSLFSSPFIETRVYPVL